MAGRARVVKPEWLEDERMLRAGTDARVTSIGLILMADDVGRGRCGVVAAATIFPEGPAAFEPALEKLRPWFVRLYEVRGQKYFEICNFLKHQTIDRPSAPKTPEPEEGQYLDPLDEDSTSPQRALAMEQEGNRKGTGSDREVGSGQARPRRTKRPVLEKPWAMTDDWKPPDDVIEAMAVKYEATRDEAERTIPEFRAYWKRTGKRKVSKNWIRTWTNRVATQAANGYLYSTKQACTRPPDAGKTGWED